MRRLCLVNYDVTALRTRNSTLHQQGVLLRKHLNPFVQYYDLGQLVTAADTQEEPVATSVNDELRQKLDASIASLDLSVRASNCLEAAKIGTIGELVRLSETDLLELRSFGKTSLQEVKEKLARLGLALGVSPAAAAGGSDPDAATIGTSLTE